MGREPPPYQVKEYRLSLDVDYDTLDFSGTVAIDLEGFEDTVLLNAIDLQIDHVRVGGEERSVHPDPAEEGFSIAGISGPSATVEVDFRGHVAEQGLMGFYRSRFGAYDLLTTQCAPTGARRIFPCVDRPDRKAPIAFDLTVDVDDEAIFNTPVVEQRTKGSRKRLTFLPTPPMATYLFYVGVGPFELLRGRASRVRLSVAAPVDRSSAGQYALDVAVRTLPALEEYFGIPFPLSKLDLIAVPDYAFGAMENWGAITFREMLLLVDKTVGVRSRRRIRSTITHELAHQWFGDLVTMAWWTDIWLNESFATFMQPTILDPLYPEAGAWAEFAIDWTAPAIFDDSLPTTHPVQAEVERPEELAEIFDHISYGKGATVLRMFSEFLGPETMRAGVRAYLERFRYANARSEDLWAELERAAGQPIAPMLKEWIARPGLPVIVAHRAGDRLTLEQRRFLVTGPADPEPPWPIPMVVELNGERRKLLISTPSLDVPLPSAASLLLNVGGAGFYRVRYDEEDYDALCTRWRELGPLDQWSVLQDLYAFLLAGEVPLELYLKFVDATSESASPTAVFEIVRQYIGPISMMEPPNLGFLLPSHPEYRASIDRLLSSQFDRLGLTAKDGESEGDGVLRAVVANALAWSGGPKATELARLFADFDSVDPDLRRAVAIAFARAGAGAEHLALVDRLGRTDDEGTAFVLEVALMSFRTPETVAASVGLLSGELLRRSHIAQLLTVLAQNPEARAATWAWLVEHGEGLAARFPGLGFAWEILGETIPYLGIGREAEVGRFLLENPWPETERGTRRALDTLWVTSRLVRELGGS